MLIGYIYSHMATVGVKGLNRLTLIDC